MTLGALTTKLCTHSETRAQAQVFLADALYGLHSKQARRSPETRAYSRNLEDWHFGQTTISVYPNELALLQFIVAPGIGAALGQPLPALLGSLTQLLLRLRKETVRLSRLETLLYLFLNPHGSTWTERDAIADQAMRWRHAVGAVSLAITHLVQVGILEESDDRFRVVGRFRT